MSYLKKDRTRESYFERMKTKAPLTVRNGRYYLQKWDSFCESQFKKNGDQVIQDLKKEDESTTYDVMQSFVNHISNGLQPSSVPNYFSRVRDYLHYMGIKLDSKDVQHNVMFPRTEYEEAEPFTTEEQLLILGLASHKQKAIYLLASSSGMRIGSIMQLRKSDFRTDGPRIMIKVRAETTKLKRAYTTFISKEAEKYVRPYLKVEDQDLVFTKNKNWHHAEINEGNIFRRLLIKSGLVSRKKTGRYKKNIHSFRAHFITKVARTDPNLSKKMTDQKGYLLQYDRLTDEDLLESYLKFESDLLIFDTSKKDNKIQELQKVNSLYQDALKAKDEAIQQRDTILKGLKLGFTPYDN